MRRRRLQSRPTALHAVATALHLAVIALAALAPRHGRRELAEAESMGRSGCSIVTPSHGSMLALTKDRVLVNPELHALCRVKEEHCGLTESMVELAVYGFPRAPFHGIQMRLSDLQGRPVGSVVSHDFCSAATWVEVDSKTRAVAFNTSLAPLLGTLDPGVYDFHVRIVCGDSEQAKGAASAVVMYPDVLPGECVPRIVVSGENRTPGLQCRGGKLHGVSSVRLALEGCEGAADRLQAQYYLRNDSLPTRFDYAAPTAFSEDAREAVNISIPYQGRHQVYAKLVSTDGMQRAVAAGILSLRTQLAEDGDHIDLDCNDLLCRDQEKDVSFESSDHDSALGVFFGNGNFNSEHHVHVLDAENQNAPQEWRQRLWTKHLPFEGTCSIVSPAHGSMIELTDDMDVVKVNALCRVKARHCATDSCRIEVALSLSTTSIIDRDVVASSKCSSAHTWIEEEDMVVQFDTNVAMRDFGVFDFDVRVVCGDSEQVKGRASAVVMYPDVLPGECVPRFSIPDEHRTIKTQRRDNRGGMSHPIRLALEGCEGTAERFQAQYYFLHHPYYVDQSLRLARSLSLFVTPTAISEDAREAVNISMPHCEQPYGRKEVYTELVSTDGMQRVVAAGILTLRTQTQAESSGIDARKEASHRFALFQRVVCAQCEKRTVECGCILGSQNPSLIVLSQFIERMLVASLADYHTVLKWIVVRPQGGLGNRNLQIVFGMMLALSTGRGLALDWDLSNSAGDHTAHAYEFDSVISFPRSEEIDGGSSIDLDCAQARHLELMMQGDIARTLENYDFVHMTCEQPAHILHGNPFVGDFLSAAFHGKPFFFLSHFVWMGQKGRQELTNISSLPLPQQWDGMRSLEDFSKLLREGRPGKIIGVHARATSVRPFENFDHRNVAPKLDAESFCKGHPGSMTELGMCVSSLIVPNSTFRADQGPTVVLWATDHDELASSLLEDLLAIQQVIVVRVSHADITDRSDSHPDTGVLDILFLGEADILVGTTGSTYSFTAHARSLAEPRYPSFRANTQDPCGSAPGTEGGLLFYGLSPECSRDDESRVTWNCHRQSECLRFVMVRGRDFCLASKREDESLSWVKSYVLDMDHAAFRAQWYARVGYTLENHFSNYRNDNFPPCRNADWWVVTLLDGMTSGFFVDLATYDAVTYSNSHVLELDYGWGGICVETQAKHWKGLLHRKCFAVAAVVSDATGAAVEFDTQFEEGGAGIVSDDHPNKGASPVTGDTGESHRGSEAPKRVTYRTVTVRKILQDFKAPPVIHYLSLDVKGSEFLVLQTFPFDAHRVLVITIERTDLCVRTILRQQGYMYLRDFAGQHEIWVHPTLPELARKLEQYGQRELMRDDPLMSADMHQKCRQMSRSLAQGLL